MDKPTVKLIGKDGNIYFIMGKAAQALRRAGQADKAEEMQERIKTEADSYHGALAIVMDYVEVE